MLLALRHLPTLLNVDVDVMLTQQNKMLVVIIEKSV